MVDLCKRLQGTKLEEDEDTRAHVIRLLDLQEQLASMGNNFDDDEIVSILSGSLPPSYEPTINVISAMADLMGISVTPDRIIRLVTNGYDHRMIKRSKIGPDGAFRRSFYSKHPEEMR